MHMRTNTCSQYTNGEKLWTVQNYQIKFISLFLILNMDKDIKQACKPLWEL